MGPDTSPTRSLIITNNSKRSRSFSLARRGPCSDLNFSPGILPWFVWRLRWFDTVIGHPFQDSCWKVFHLHCFDENNIENACYEWLQWQHKISWGLEIHRTCSSQNISIFIECDRRPEQNSNYVQQKKNACMPMHGPKRSKWTTCKGQLARAWIDLGWSILIAFPYLTLAVNFALT